MPSSIIVALKHNASERKDVKKEKKVKKTQIVSNNCYTVKHIYHSLVSFSFHFRFHLYFTIYTFFFVILFLTFQASPLVILFLIFLFFSKLTNTNKTNRLRGAK